MGGDPVGWLWLSTITDKPWERTGYMAAYKHFSDELFYQSAACRAVGERMAHPLTWGRWAEMSKSLIGTGAKVLNRRGHVVGFSSLPDNMTFNAFLWTRETGKMKALIPLKGIANSIAIALNDSDEVVGSSIDSTFTILTATIWKNCYVCT